MSIASVRTPTVLLIGASRGLGYATVAEFLKKGWDVVDTVRDGSGRTLLNNLAGAHLGRIAIETLDITQAEQIRALRERLSDWMFDVLFA